MHPLLGRAEGRQAGRYGLVCWEGSHRDTPEPGSLGILGEDVGSQLGVCNQVLRLWEAAAVCLGKDWRQEPQRGNHAGGFRALTRLSSEPQPQGLGPGPARSCQVALPREVMHVSSGDCQGGCHGFG